MNVLIDSNRNYATHAQSYGDAEDVKKVTGEPGDTAHTETHAHLRTELQHWGGGGGGWGWGGRGRSLIF